MKSSAIPEQGKLAARFSALDSRRSEVLNRAEQAARYTVPALFVRNGHTESARLRKPYQGLGARAVNTLSAKIMLALFPPNSAFFKMDLDDVTADALKQAGANVEKVRETLASTEQRIVSRLERTLLRAVFPIATKSLIVTGNYLLHIGKDMTIRGFGLRSYVVNRDPEGAVLEIITKEEVAPETLPEAVRVACDVRDAEDGKSSEKNVAVYTQMLRSGNKYLVEQEINGKAVPGSTGSYPIDAPPFIALRWSHIHGEDYGRGMVDEYIGDFIALDDLSRDLLKGSALAAKVLFMRNPNAVTTAKKFAAAESGAVLDGKDTDLRAVTLDKYADFNVTLQRVKDIEQSLKEAFLMTSSIQRKGERVTAEEIRTLAQDLEDSLGGIYSLLSVDQKYMLYRIIDLMTKSGEIPRLPKRDVKLTIITGLDALGRGHELNKLRNFVGLMRELVGEEEARMRLKSDTIATKIGTALGLDTSDLVASNDEVAASRNEAMAREMAAKAAPGVATQVTKGVMEQ